MFLELIELKRQVLAELKNSKEGFMVAHTSTALIWEYPRGSGLDIYSLNRISQQYQAWSIKGSDIEEGPKGAHCTGSQKLQMSVFGTRTSRQKELACTELRFSMSDESFYNPGIGK